MARKIAILGGTGALGTGLALRWAAAGHGIIIGSRSSDNAAAAVAGLRDTLAERGAGDVDLASATNAEAAAAHAYPSNEVGCLMLYTSQESMLDELISRPLDEGDAFSNANTLIYMGKTRDGNRIGRSLYIAKHRGSACSEEIIPYSIDDSGVRLS